MKQLLYVAPLFEVECGYLLNRFKGKFGITTIKGRWRSFNENEIPSKFPRSSSELKEFGAVIFSDVGSENFTPQQLVAVKEHVSSGGAFLMIGGYASYAGYELMGNYLATPIAEILPVHIGNNPDAINVPRGFFVSPVNVKHPILEGIDWSEVPVAVGFNRVETKRDAEVLLTYKENPILVTGEYGEGRTAAFMTDAHPHWSGGWTDWEYYQLFWRNLINWLCRDI